MKIGFLGAGHMAQAMIKGWLKAGFAPGDILVNSPRSAAQLAADLDVVVADLKTVTAQSDVLVLAFLPQHLPNLAAEINAHLRPETVVVSVLGSTRLTELQAALPVAQTIVRTLPNVAVAQNVGITALAGESAARDKVQALLEKLGTVIVSDEAQMPIISALAGSGPAFVAEFMESLAKAGVKHGLTKQDASALVRQLLVGTVAISERQSFTDLVDQVASPGGSTIAGVLSLEADALSGTVVRAIDATIDAQ